MKAAYKNAKLAWRGTVKALSVQAVSNSDKNTKFVNELIGRVAQIVADRCRPVKLGKETFPSDTKPADVLAQLEYEAIKILAAEIRFYPDIATMFPESFRQGVLSGYPENLTSLERAVIVIAQSETPATGAYEDHFAMKAASIVFALQEGGAI